MRAWVKEGMDGEGHTVVARMESVGEIPRGSIDRTFVWWGVSCFSEG